MNHRPALILSWIAILAGCGQEVVSEPAVEDTRPNILLLVADDLGYADLGVYGSDIETPNIDALADRGLLFTQFHAAPLCAPTRAMLLSGNNNHVAGMARQSYKGIAGNPVRGYEASLSDRVVPFPRLMRDAGYNTYTVGKWHLGLESHNSPTAAGFTRAYNLLQGAGTHFDAKGYKEGGSTYRLDGELTDYPVGEYSTAVYTDRMIEFIEADAASGKPFFAFVAYTSPHWPLQVPDEYLDLYADHYDDGYDSLRERRFASLQLADIIPADATLPPRNDAITPWEDLTPEEQRIESRKMELYAAMVDNLDDHVGRLLDFLEAGGLLDNTLVIFMSDNGAAAESFYERGSFSEYLQANFDNAYDKMGTAESFVSYDKQWAEAGSAPFSRYKGFTREGGMIAPAIMAGAGVQARGAKNRSYFTVMDLAPTFLEIAGATYPEDDDVEPMLGESLLPVLSGDREAAHDEEYVTVLHHGGRAFLRQGDWKLVTLDGPFDESKFELFNLARDPGETTDLAEAEPEHYERLIELWRKERSSLGIILPEDL